MSGLAMLHDDRETRPSLLLRIRDPRDRGAWDEFASIYLPVITGFCRKRGLQEADAADVSQEVLEAVSRHIRGFDYDPGRGSFRGWLFTVVRSKLGDLSRARRREPQGGGSAVHELLDRQPAAEIEDIWEREYREHVLRWAAERVRDEFQTGTWEAFWRTSVLEEATASVAGALGLSLGAVYVARSRVLARLKQKVATIGDAWPGSGAADRPA